MKILNEVIRFLIEQDLKDLDENLQVLWDMMSNEGFSNLKLLNKNTIILYVEEFEIWIVAANDNKIYVEFSFRRKDLIGEELPELEFASSEDPRNIAKSIIESISDSILKYEGDFNVFWKKLPETGSGHKAFIRLGDGTKLSIQAGTSSSYSRPRGKSNRYSSFEVGFPSREIPELMPYIEMKEDEPTKSVYPYVPVETLEIIMSTYGFSGISLY
jgi:hypothetical protein